MLRNRHLAEWRFRPLMRIVTVNPKIWKVNVIGIGTPPLQRIPEKKPPVAVLAPLGFKKNHTYFTRPVEKCQSMVYAVPLAKEKHGILYNRRALPVNGQRPLAILRCAAGTACVCSAFVLQEVPHIEYLRRENVGKLHKLRDEAAAAVDRDTRRFEQRPVCRLSGRQRQQRVRAAAPLRL